MTHHLFIADEYLNTAAGSPDALGADIRFVRSYEPQTVPDLEVNLIGTGGQQFGFNSSGFQKDPVRIVVVDR